MKNNAISKRHQFLIESRTSSYMYTGVGTNFEFQGTWLKMSLGCLGGKEQD